MKKNLILGTLIFLAVAVMVVVWMTDDQVAAPLALNVKLNQIDPDVIAVDVLTSEPANISASYTDGLAGSGRPGVIGQGRFYYNTNRMTIDLGRKRSYLSGKGKIVVQAKTSAVRSNSTVLYV